MSCVNCNRQKETHEVYIQTGNNTIITTVSQMWALIPKGM